MVSTQLGAGIGGDTAFSFILSDPPASMNKGSVVEKRFRSGLFPNMALLGGGGSFKRWGLVRGDGSLGPPPIKEIKRLM
jgi:hypothetical protein